MNYARIAVIEGLISELDTEIRLHENAIYDIQDRIEDLEEELKGLKNEQET